MLKRVLGALSAGLLVGSLGVLAACSGTEDETPAANSAQAIQSANVSIVMHDQNGLVMAKGSGIAIAPRAVLTAGHLVAGAKRWTITTADGKRVNGTVGKTADWMYYDKSNKAHPRKTDVAVIYLDAPLDLKVYPKLATERVALGGKGARINGHNGSFKRFETHLGRFRNFSHAYVARMDNNEMLDTGGAVVNENNEIVGVVSGRGLKSGFLHIARTDELVGNFIQPKAACAGNNSVSVRTYGAPPPKPGCEKDAGASSSSSGGSSSGGSSSGGSSSGGSSSGGSSSGGSSSGGGPNGNCNDGPGNTWPGGGGGGGSSSGGSSSGGSSGTDTNNTSSSSGGSSGTTSSGGSSGTTSSGGSSGTTSSSGGSSGADNNTSSSSSGGSSGTTSSGGSSSGGSSGSSGAGSSGTSGGSSGVDGNNNPGTSSSGGSGAGSTSGGSSGTSGSTSSSSGSSGSDNNNTSSSSGGSSGGGAGSSQDGDQDFCEGENDDSEVCPPETNGSNGPNAGGDNTGESVDYGFASADQSGDDPLVIR